MHSFESLEVPQGAVGIHWFGQNSFAFKDTAGTTLLVDPYFPRDRPGRKFIHRQPPLDERTLKTDFVLLTHEHGDHTCPESLFRIHAAFPSARYCGPKESIARLKEIGIPEELLSPITAGDTVWLGTVTVHAIWAKPPAGIPEESIPTPDVEHLGYVLDVGAVRVYVSGDLINTFAKHDNLIGPIAKLKPDIGLLTTHPTEGEFPFFEGSVEMAVKLKLKAAVPAHYGCFIKRTYDPHLWAAGFPSDGPTPIIIPYNEAIVYPS
jgi:L-ascorbate metabolism protein UlaG (beta-lactamase superfamily)